jgi:penicillin amidase
VGWGGPHVGSNWLVLGGSRTTTGKPIVINDPHVELRAPSLFHLSRLKGGPYDVAGAALPGVPGVILGRNRRIAWCFTNVMIDDTDLFSESLHPIDPFRYRVGENWERLGTIEEFIRVKGERTPRRRTIRVSRHGPLLSDAFATPGGDGGARVALAVRWTAAEASAELDGLLAVNRAASWREFVEACRSIVAPGQNAGFADAEGNIGYYCTGKIPVRAGGRPRVLPDGARGEGEWLGAVPFEEQPHVFNPPAGYIASANNQVAGESYPYYISAFFDAPYRARRLHEIVREKGKLSPEAAEKVSLDARSIQAEEMVALLLRPLEDRLKSIAGGDVQVALNYVLNWDFRCTADSIAASIFHVFYMELLREVFEPALGEDLFIHFVENWNEHCLAVEKVLADPMNAWFEGRPRDDLVCRAFERAVAWLGQRLGRPTQSWTWGRLHRLTLRHAFHSVPLMRRLFDIGPFPTPGSGTTLNNGQWLAAEPFEQIGGAGFRHVADLADGAATRVALPGGQSGNPASPHHADLVEGWLEGKYFPIPFEREKVAAVSRIVLEPGR